MRIARETVARCSGQRELQVAPEVGIPFRRDITNFFATLDSSLRGNVGGFPSWPAFECLSRAGMTNSFCGNLNHKLTPGRLRMLTAPVRRAGPQRLAGAECVAEEAYCA